MASLTKDNPARAKRDSTIAQLRLQGLPLSQIAKATGLTKGRISHILNDAEVKSVIDMAQRSLAEYGPEVVSLFLQEALTPGADGYKARRDWFKSMGILPSHAQSTFIGQINVQVNAVGSPEVASILSKALSQPGDLIDLEPPGDE